MTSFDKLFLSWWYNTVLYGISGPFFRNVCAHFDSLFRRVGPATVLTKNNKFTMYKFASVTTQFCMENV
jgi:hypothetical protein